MKRYSIHKTVLHILCLTSILCFITNIINPCYAGEINDKWHYISLVDLLSNKDKYHDKRVQVEGYLIFTFEGHGLYLSREHADYIITKNGVWLEYADAFLKNASMRKYNKRWVILAGRYDMNKNGHLGLWSGSIVEIESVKLLDKRTL